MLDSVAEAVGLSPKRSFACFPASEAPGHYRIRSVPGSGLAVCLRSCAQTRPHARDRSRLSRAISLITGRQP